MSQYIDPEVQKQLDLIAQLSQVTEQESLAERDGDITRNANGRIVSGPDGPDEALLVSFTTEATYSRLHTLIAGGVPTYIDTDFVTIVAPGQANQTLIHTPVTPYHQWRFPVEYRRFKDGQASLVIGVPLALWPLLSPSQVKSLEAQGVRTVEQVAELSDGTAIAGLQSLKNSAKAYLAQAKDVAAASKMQAEFDQRDKQHAADMAAMKAQHEDLMKLVQKLQTEDKPKGK